MSPSGDGKPLFARQLRTYGPVSEELLRTDASLTKDPEASPKCATRKEVYATAGRWPDVSALSEPTRRPLRPEMPLGCGSSVVSRSRDWQD